MGIEKGNVRKSVQDIARGTKRIENSGPSRGYVKVRRSNSLPVSVIICSRNRPHLLEAAVQSILEGQAVPTELIVVDQSDRPNKQLADRQEESSAIRYLWTREAGLSRANNLGAALAQHDILVFTHDDVLVSSSWLQTLVRAVIEQGPRSVVTGRVLPSNEEQPGGHAPTLKTDEERAVYADANGIGMLMPLNMGLYGSVLEQIGGFDVRLGPGTAFPGAEDSDLGFRVLRKGYRLVYVPEAVVYHRAWRGERDYLPIRWGYGVAQGAFYAKHLLAREPWILSHMFLDLRRRMWRFPGRLWRERHRGLSEPLYLLGNVVGALRWLLTVQRKR